MTAFLCLLWLRVRWSRLLRRAIRTCDHGVPAPCGLCHDTTTSDAR